MLEPTSAGEAADLLAGATANRTPVATRGSGTKQHWGTPSETARTCVSTLRLAAPLQHYAGDLVATIPAGVSLAAANAELMRAGQWLPLDPPHADRATIGGIVATNASGPRRHKHGAPRDLIIGIEVALADGRVARAGGRVVKNVAGYDLSRLFCGSLGSLGIITSATFKLAPATPASRTLVVHAPTALRAVELATLIAAAPVTPSALEIAAPSSRLLVRFESTAAAADRMAASIKALLESGGATTDLVDGRSEQEAWQRHEEAIWERPGAVLKISVLPTEVSRVLARLEHNQHRVDWSLAGRVGLGVLLVRVNGEPAATHAVVADITAAIATRGHVVVLEGTDDLRALAQSSRDTRALPLMKAVKARFDPNDILPPL